MKGAIHKDKEETVQELKNILRYYIAQKQQFKIELETRSLNEYEKLSLYKKNSVYALKIEVIAYCLERNNL